MKKCVFNVPGKNVLNNKLLSRSRFTFVRCVFGVLCEICLVFPFTVEAIEFWAGSAVVPIGIPEGISLAGFGNGDRRNWWFSQNNQAHYFTASEGTHDPIKAKALILKMGSEKFVIVSTDLLLVTSAMRQEVWRRVKDLGYQSKDIILSATHTHSGPSSYIQNTLFEFLVTDKYVPEIFQHLMKGIEQSIRQAEKNLQVSQIAIGTRNIADVIGNRREGRSLDPVLTVLRIDSVSGEPLATLVNLPIHPTMMGATNLWLSADVPGAIETALTKKTGAVTLFINGAEGDVTPTGPRGTFANVNQLGEKISEDAFKLWSRLEPQTPSLFKMHVVQRNIGPASLNLFACLHFNQWSGTWLPTIDSLTQNIELLGIRIDEQVLVTIPGEPTTSIGLRIKELGTILGFTSTSVFGLTNDYMGYILEEDEYLTGGYEACASFYGPTFGEQVYQGAKDLLEGLAASGSFPHH